MSLSGVKSSRSTLPKSEGRAMPFRLQNSAMRSWGMEIG